MSDFLAHDMFIDVLTRLPIKTLVRCACVCKSWYSFLTNPNFITTHLNRSSIANTDNNNNNNFLLVRSRSGDKADVVHYSLLRSEKGMLCDNAELELPLKDPSDRFLRIIGSCNGLVCLVEDFHGYGRSFYLWNPSIRKTITLPPLRVSFQSHGAFMHSVGFGFDARTDDYKVVRIVYLWPPDDFKLPPEIDIFSLSTGTWRNISHLGLQYVIYERAPQAYLNGSAHWLAYNRRREGFCSLIVSFHMGDEIFNEIMVPAGCTFYSGSNACVAKFQESLSLIHGIWVQTCSILVMKEYSISGSWTKQFSIDTSVGFKTVVGFTRKGKVLLLNSVYLVADDPYTEQVLHLSIRGTTDRWCMEMLILRA